MKDDSKKIEKRLENMKNFYLKLGSVLDNLPDSIPDKTKDMLKNTIRIRI